MAEYVKRKMRGFNKGSESWLEEQRRKKDLDNSHRKASLGEEEESFYNNQGDLI